MPLTDSERVKIRHHMGYLNVASASTFVLGIPAGVQTQFMIEGAFDRILESAMGEIRRHVVILDTIEEQMVGDLELLAVNKIGEIETNPKEQEKLVNRYDYWVSSLGNLMGISRNPYDARLKAGGNSINVSVC